MVVILVADHLAAVTITITEQITAGPLATGDNIAQIPAANTTHLSTAQIKRPTENMHFHDIWGNFTHFICTHELRIEQPLSYW